jgi:hypothetical protein
MAVQEVKITDQIIKSVDRMTFYNLVTSEIMATVNQLSSINLNQTQDVVWYVGKNGVRLDGIDTNKNLEVTGTNGFIDLGVLSLQTGNDVQIYDGTTTFMESPYVDELVTADGLVATTALEAYSATTGAEIAYVYKPVGSGILGALKFTQAATADATHFAYDPATKEITLPTGVFSAGESLVAQYNYKAVGTSISSDTQHFSKTAKVVIDLTTEDCLYIVPYYSNVI